MNLPKLSLIVLRAANMAATLAFYRVLGLDFVQEQHGAGAIHYACNLDGTVFEIYPLRRTDGADESNVGRTTMIGFEVESLDSTLAALSELGIAPTGVPRSAEWGRWINVADPDGRTVQINETAK